MTTSRVPAGSTAGGQFAPDVRTEPTVALLRAPDAQDFSYEDEKARGKELTRALEALPKLTVRAMVGASGVADLMRESYPEYWAEREAPRTREESRLALEEALPHTPRDRREELTELVRFAVHEEMKHWEDPEYVLNAEHDWELLVEAEDYTDEDDWARRGTEQNRERWEMLANTAAFHAVNADESYAAMRGAA